MKNLSERLQKLKCVVIVPTYNNAGTVGTVVEELKRYSKDIIVVNDGSTDSTLDILVKIPGIDLISYQKNKGKGEALKLAFIRAIYRDFDYAITIDADGQHYTDDLHVFVEGIEKSPDSLLIGARNLHAENMPSKNSFANKFSNFWFYLETGVKLNDTQSGYRLYPIKKLQNIHFISAKYEFEVEVMVKAVWRGIKVKNVPIKVYYAPEEERVSHFRPFKDFVRISGINLLLVIGALLFYYPLKFIKQFTWSNIKSFIKKNIIRSEDSNLKLSLSMGWGVFCGIIPIWGYQLLFAFFSAGVLRLNKIVSFMFSNISIPPLIPFILYFSYKIGGAILGKSVPITLHDISFKAVSNGLFQYIVGSLVFAVAMGVLTFAIAYVLLKIFRKERVNG